ncbi:lipocalin family protein [Bacteroides sp. 519]|uniref:lipocalin family protein n=1 Tax=Bacteroides sp. 519 TaxID=2302937 RepID=UPI0013D0B457|nr:lipocalin family protein [Bacteroides sp. 519]NDV60081.1 hypothetical protein [Bacteroides sp. 519]
MKKLVYLLPVLFSLLVFTACSDDDDKIDMSLITGTWEIDKVEISGVYIDPPSTFEGITATFNADKTFAISMGETPLGGTYEIEGETITCSMEGVEVGECKILKLSNTQAEIQLNFAELALNYKVRCKRK